MKQGGNNLWAIVVFNGFQDLLFAFNNSNFNIVQDLRNCTNYSGNLLKKMNLYTIYSGTA